MSIVQVFNTEDVRQKIFKYKMQYNEPPIYLKMYLPLKYILYTASIADTAIRKIQEEERLAYERGERDSWSCGMFSNVEILHTMGLSWRDYSKKRHNELVKCKMNDNKLIYVYGLKDSRFPNTKMFKFSLIMYNKHKKNYTALVKALKIMRRFKMYYENKIIKLVADYIRKRKKQNKQPCPICNKMMNKSSINRHIKSRHT